GVLIQVRAKTETSTANAPSPALRSSRNETTAPATVPDLLTPLISHASMAKAVVMANAGHNCKPAPVDHPTIAIIQPIFLPAWALSRPRLAPTGNYQLLGLSSDLHQFWCFTFIFPPPVMCIKMERCRLNSVPWRGSGAGSILVKTRGLLWRLQSGQVT